MNWKKDEIVLIVNQDSRRSVSKAKALQTLARRHKLKTISCAGPNLDHTIRQALERKRLKRLIIAGGDGSVTTAARLVMEQGRGVEVAVIPTGTANYYAKSLGFKTLPIAFQVAVTGHSEKRYLCMANGRIFSIAASMGVTSRMFDKVTNTNKKWFGKLAYFWGIGKLILTYKPMRIKIQANNKSYEFVTTELQIVNQSIFSRMKVEPEIHAREPAFEIITYGTKNTKLSPLFALIIFMLTLGKNQKYLKRIKTTKVKINTSRTEIVSLDGEVLESTPVDIEVCKKPVNFVTAS